MKTAEEKANEYLERVTPLSAPVNAAYNGYVAGYNEAIRWRDPKEKLPEKAGCDFCRDEQGYTIGNMYVCDKCGRQVP